MRRILGVAMVLVVIAGRGHAQSNDSTAIAEQLFNQARELTKADQWAEACTKFEASLRYDPALGTLLNLATCDEHIGKLASAWSLYREAIEIARKAGDIKRRDYALKHVAALEPRLPKLTISAPATVRPGFVVERDGTRIETGALGVALYVDPGTHAITASTADAEVFTQEVTLVEGEARTLVIPELTVVPAPKPAVPAGPTAEPASSPDREPASITRPAGSPSAVRTYVAIGTGVAGIAAAGAGVVFGVQARSSFLDAKALCGASLACEPASYDRGKQLIHDTRSSATTSTVLVAAGGAAIVASAVLLLTRPRTGERATAKIVPVTHDRGAGLAVLGRF